MKVKVTRINNIYNNEENLPEQIKPKSPPNIFSLSQEEIRLKIQREIFNEYKKTMYKKWIEMNTPTAMTDKDRIDHLRRIVVEASLYHKNKNSVELSKRINNIVNNRMISTTPSTVGLSQKMIKIIFDDMDILMNNIKKSQQHLITQIALLNLWRI
jgi:hypothetical protein